VISLALDGAFNALKSRAATALLPEDLIARATHLRELFPREDAAKSNT